MRGKPPTIMSRETVFLSHFNNEKLMAKAEERSADQMGVGELFKNYTERANRMLSIAMKIEAKAASTISVLLAVTGIGLFCQPIQAQELLWSSTYGGRNNEGGASCRRLSNGGYIVIGSTFSYGSGDYDIYLLEIDNTGDTLWSRTFGGSGVEHGYDVAITPDNGLLIVGSTTSFGAGSRDAYIIKTDSLGNELWSRTFGGTLADEARAITLHPDSGFVITGITESFGPGYTDVYLIRLNSDGDSLWTRAYGGVGGDNSYSIQRTLDNDYIVIGSTGSFGVGYSSIYALKIDQYGDTLWTKTYGGVKADFGRSVKITQDGGFVFVGRTHSFGAGYGDAYLVKTDADGNFQWENYFGGSWEDNAYTVYASADGGYLLAGTTESFGVGGIDIYVIKTDPSGKEIWSRTFGGAEADYARCVIQNDNFDYFLVGHSWTGSAGGSDLYLFEISGDSPTPVEEYAWDNLLPESIELGQNYPNPFNSSTTIPLSLNRPATLRVTLYNLLGQTVRSFGTINLPVGDHQLTWDGKNDFGRDVASGLYFFRIETSGLALTRKMMLLK